MSLYAYVSGAVAFIATVALMPIARRWGVRWGICDFPQDDPLKVHKGSIPLLGGIAMFLSIALSLVLFLFFARVGILGIVGILLGGAIAASLGLLDDLGWKNRPKQYRPRVKFALQVSASVAIAIILWFTGFRFEFIPIGIIGILMGIFYIFGGMNAINMQDGIDGLAGGLVLISSLGFAVLAQLAGDALGLTIALALFGAALGFLLFNFPPASIFMGDSGSHFLGFILALLAIIFTSRSYDIRWFVGPILIIGLPVFDAAWAVMRRLIRRKPLFEGDRGHLYDRMTHRGLTVKQTVLICYLIQAVFVAGGVTLVLL